MWSHRASGIRPDDYPFSIDTEVAFIIAKTLLLSFRFIRSTEAVVIIDVTIPAAVRMTTSDTTLSETIFSIVPGKRLRMLTLMSLGLNEREEVGVDRVCLCCGHAVWENFVG